MAATLTTEVLNDDLAVSIARALAAANQRAREAGIDVAGSLITVSQRSAADGLVWRVNYGPKEYVGRRGGDLIVDVTGGEGRVTQVLRGQ